MQESGIDLSFDSVIHYADMNDKPNSRQEKVLIVRTSPLTRWACTVKSSGIVLTVQVIQNEFISSSVTETFSDAYLLVILKCLSEVLGLYVGAAESLVSGQSCAKTAASLLLGWCQIILT